MKHSYLAGMLVDLATRAGSGAVAGADRWAGPAGGEHEHGLMVQFRDGSALGFKIVAASPVGGHPGGPDEYQPADLPAVDVSAAQPSGPGAKATVAWLGWLVESAGHPGVARVEVAAQGGLSLLLVDDAGYQLHVLPVRAVGPGGRKLPDWQPADWGGMA